MDFQVKFSLVSENIILFHPFNFMLVKRKFRTTLKMTFPLQCSGKCIVFLQYACCSRNRCTNLKPVTGYEVQSSKATKLKSFDTRYKKCVGFFSSEIFAHKRKYNFVPSIIELIKRKFCTIIKNDLALVSQVHQVQRGAPTQDKNSRYSQKDIF